MPENNQNLEKWYESKLGFLAIVFFPILAGAIAVTLYIGQISTQVAVEAQSVDDIKVNDLAHIELEITALQQQESDLDTSISLVQQTSVANNTILNELIKK